MFDFDKNRPQRADNKDMCFSHQVRMLCLKVVEQQEDELLLMTISQRVLRWGFPGAAREDVY